MQPRLYLDIEIKGPNQPLAAAAVLRALHGAFRNAPGRYALALPCYPRSAFRLLRIFGGNGDDLITLREHLLAVPDFDKHMTAHSPRPIPAGFDGPWYSYRRYRIPTRSAERHPDGNLRARRMQQADEAGYPYFNLHSRSNGQTFGLYIQRLDANSGDRCQPDSYGLASASRPFALPHLPAPWEST
ncbi:type I-F CRISPR-associated endoribonuclease Cas6/Csy4 [Parachitinimonas caeni]|uniref:Type I-F CRISPR-associated endoribonuclease Cas6/Csy4 n=1 Tax=Parachitinimonas caeni TaxID=3031301 RepID=A0ABT7E3G9_9NEIS|nr:type I-F CRISPR-associated endoribonuclease Cas6/Csy4 [Parachitinimonas caeni]MDK2126594.1 type I-F CRISPR-associated endoribonuclease Cas6/Csy4 [Parachitinimonas caeni]